MPNDDQEVIRGGPVNGSIDRLIAFWRGCRGSNGNWIHPADREVLMAPRFYDRVRWTVPASQREVIDEHRRVPARLQGGLIPQPFIGDIKHAEIVLCLLNPGLDPGNWLVEREGSEGRRRKLACLHQEHGSQPPFWAVDLELADTGAFTYWWPRFAKLADALVGDGWTFDEAMADLSRRVACIEIVPYHSRNGDPVFSQLIAALPSSQQAITAVREKAAEGAQVIFFRSHANWGLEDNGGTIRHAKDSTRSIVMGPATIAGRLIRRRMNPDPAALAPFAELFARDGFQFGRWEGGVTTDGIAQMPWFAKSDEGRALLKAIYDGRWVLPGFSWIEWTDSEEARHLYDEPGAIETASIRQIGKLLTTIARQDRFSEGTLAATVKSGLMLRILERIAEFAGEAKAQEGQT